ncbi:MAG: CoA-binding protein [Candidatus Saccharicenans sp.]|nr:MAG: CoA-binding protein [Candidatus Aminicenantes bacterium]HEK85932.1 CoA-binding protein [Candidatus Aminicenantes bacterium]
MPLNDSISGFLKQKEIAVIGASRNPAKYGHIIYKKLKSAGYQVYAVNPEAQFIDGDPCYPDLFNLPKSVKAAIVITPPKITEKIAHQLLQAKYEFVWLQPGAESESAINLLSAGGISVIYNACLLLRMPE